MVPGAGIEPARGFPRGILSPLRLPISPPGLGYGFNILRCQASESQHTNCMEARSGIEPLLTALQAAASPLCHPANARYYNNRIFNNRIICYLFSHTLRIKKPRLYSRGSRIWSGKRGSNSRPQPWQGCALPLSYSRL